MFASTVFKVLALCLAVAGIATVTAEDIDSSYVSWCVYSDSSCSPEYEIECTMVPVDGSCDVHHFDHHSFGLHYTNTTDINIQFYFDDNCAGGHSNFTIETHSCVHYFDFKDPPNFVYLAHVNEAVAETLQQVAENESDTDSALAVAISALVVAIAFVVVGSVALVYVVRTVRRNQTQDFGGDIKRSITSPSDTQVSNMRTLE
ncbi:hypothetical protein SARC_11418 [Sphaeroforma arctica JP610]|uniref:GOLD domain-containing protein n=1 Tax=Sphaeroforma arctica JP610 TaxID=667725 RepID=A0A0L0FI01_9EUKA|nr:hypothetical protein SARC_11418 [Sphaeroforma arctica JP610]KNC76071.1 hypothetical protein SARC_11418 [Sphaeroforma arctica JP610]|eukprot:XP_014149973.1 hypothetical protein SARC_11418 [Sphaeroforma arctica JP610]